jgi:hypothetical protein
MMTTPRISSAADLAKELGFDEVESSAPSTSTDDSETTSEGSKQQVPKPAADDVGLEKPVETPEERPAPSNPLVVIQSLYALLILEGAYWVVDKMRLDQERLEGQAPKLALSNQRNGSLMISRTVKAMFPQADPKPVVNDFFQSPLTTCYTGIEFNPGTTTSGALNLWVGPTITSCAGDAELIKRLLFVVLCGRDTKKYKYLLNFLAHALQHPEEKPGVMIILMGGQGTGKGTFGRILQEIWRATYLQVHKIDNITGNFNGSLERSFIVFMDEALFVGNRGATDSLKSLVTEPYILINEKHQPTRQIQSYHRFFAATNAMHLKHTERDDRRDFALRLSDEYKGDHAFWTALYASIDAGGVAALVHELLAVDLSDFNVRDKPQTEELLEQKLRSLEGIERWWCDGLHDGGLPPSGAWPEFVSTRGLTDSILDTRGIKLFRRPMAREVVQTILLMCPSAKPDQRRLNSERQRGLQLPSLEQARKDFETWIGSAIDW